MNLGDTLKKCRVDGNKKLKTVADAVGISVTALISIEKGRSIPRAETFRRICEVLGVTPDYVVLSSLDEADIHPDRREVFNAVRRVVLEIMNS